MIPQQMKLVAPILMCILLPAMKAEADEFASPMARPGCNDNCGDVSIPFPFGIGDNCSLDSWFDVECKASPYSKPFLSKFNVEIVGMGTRNDYSSPTVGVRLPPFNVCTAADTQRHQLSSLDLRGSPYDFSIGRNSFVMEGCAGSGLLSDIESKEIVAGCSTVCGYNQSGILSNKCHGVECCQSHLQANGSNTLQFYGIDIHGEPSGRRQNCLVATMIATESVDEYMGKLSTSDAPTVPVVLSWRWTSSVWPDQTSPYTHFHIDVIINSLECRCLGNSFGKNPYVTNGCPVPKECKECHGSCEHREELSTYYCRHSNPFTFFISTVAIIVYVAIGIAIFPLLVVFGCRWLYYCTKRRKKAEKRVRFFKLMLQRHQASNDGVVEMNTKLFTHKELDKATNHFNENRVLGKSGQGTVYKGMLVDGRIVAVKKSKLMDESQMEQFINEIVILSQIYHRNVVKVLGCCLETEVPLLVYEFISNGTLDQHIHEHTDADFRLSWAMRLKIAADSAGAVAYLNSSSSTPIYHRDIKPSNILLDDKYRAKVSDFGSSKTISMDQTHLTTLVQGTIGYLDPEYYESNIFTEKSDVYSFGVIMLEILTGKKPIYRDETMEQKILVREFFFQTQTFGLSDILDPEVLKEAKVDELMVFADLAKQCLNESGRYRPTMKEVEMRLEMIIKSPAETSMDMQAFPNEGFSEIGMLETSYGEIVSSPIVGGGGAASPLYIDVEPLLRDTV